MFRYAENEPYYPPIQTYYHQEGGNFYSTLPTKKSQYFTYDAPPERSVTPDITRGLERTISTLPRGSTFKSDQNLLNMGRNIGIPVVMPQLDMISIHKESFYGDYRSENPNNRSQNLCSTPTPEDSLKISPIDPIRTSGGFKSSTPSQMKASANLENKLLSPKRSTMSNEELYAVIHKTKKKLNIDDDLERASPPIVLPSEPEMTSTPKKVSVETGYIGSRQSWSPSKGEYIDFNADIDKFSPINEPKSRQSWACNDRKGVKKTSTLDFKKLLLQKSSSLSGGNKKISAVEQLKLSKQQMQSNKQDDSQNTNKAAQNIGNMTILDLSASPRSLVNRRMLNNPPGSPERGTVKPVPKILSPRSQWRFTNPRSDVLSSTIMEDCREDETSSSASKSSLEKRSLQSLRDSTGSLKSSPGAGEKRISQSSLFSNSKEADEKSDKGSPKSTKTFISGKEVEKGSNSPKSTKEFLYNNKKETEKSSNIKSEKNVSPKSNLGASASTKYVSVSERMSAQRAKFFSEGKAQLESQNNKSPPTLETAF